MKTVMLLRPAIFLLLFGSLAFGAQLKLNDHDYFEAQGISVLLHHNAFHGVFYDQKLAGLEIILHGERIATDGDIRLLPTPEQWDPVPHFRERKRGPNGSLIAYCSYPDQGLSYRIEVTPEAEGFRVAVHLDQPLPPALTGKAGFNLEFLPTAYFGKSYVLDTGSGIFPRHPNGQMELDTKGVTEPLPLAKGNKIVLSPEDAVTRVSIASDNGPIMLYDGRNKAQNGWFVVRTLIPSGKTENAVVWHVRPNVIAGWTRPPVVAYNQVGYTPARSKVAVIELDPLYKAPASAAVLKLSPQGDYREVFHGAVEPWGKWLRYQYAHFDFSSVREPGLYVIEFAGQKTKPFRIADDVYRTGVWQPSLDTFLPEQMDHVKVREQYRIWHGASHLDDARQAPINYTHFDGYSMGPTTDTPFAPGEHIPGLNVGGWFDAGDFDIRTESQTHVITDLVLARENFGLDWDQTSVDEQARYVQIRKPDGIPDAVQQIEHGVIQLLAQYKAVGHAIPGIIAPTLEQYTHLGDAASKTDGRIYSDKMGPLESDGIHSGVPDDRWAFTTHVTGLNYNSIAALAAASRVLHGYNDAMAEECWQTATRAWDEEHKHAPVIFDSFNTTGGDPAEEEVKAAVELLVASKGGDAYRQRLKKILPVIEKHFAMLGATASRALPFMDADFKNALANGARSYKELVDKALAKNPYGVPISTGTWGGSGTAAGFGASMYFLHQAFPEIIGPEYTLRSFDYVLGRHPVSNVSYVSTVGTDSKLIGYGNNRADYSFIPGGMIPGVVIVQPDFPELKAKWPFLWFENEYVITAATSFILDANAAEALAQ
jgi:endoglucanase